MEELFHSHHSNPVLKTAIVAIMVCGALRMRNQFVTKNNIKAGKWTKCHWWKLYRGREGKRWASIHCSSQNTTCDLPFFRSTFSKVVVSFIFSRWLCKRWRCYPPWCRRERPSAGHGSPERRHRSGYPDSWRGGAASWGTNSRPEPPTSTAAGRRLTAETRWCPPSTRGGLEDKERRWRRRRWTVRWQERKTRCLNVLKCLRFII